MRRQGDSSAHAFAPLAKVVHRPCLRSLQLSKNDDLLAGPLSSHQQPVFCFVLFVSFGGCLHQSQRVATLEYFVGIITIPSSPRFLEPLPRSICLGSTPPVCSTVRYLEVWCWVGSGRVVQFAWLGAAARNTQQHIRTYFVHQMLTSLVACA